MILHHLNRYTALQRVNSALVGSMGFHCYEAHALGQYQALMGVGA